MLPDEERWPPLVLYGIKITPIVVFNFTLWLFFTLAYLYQVIYALRGLFQGVIRLPEAKKSHSFAFVIAAHNAEPVIGNLVRSIVTQDYDGDIGCFVIA